MKTHDFVLVAGDTDGLAFRKQDQSGFTKEEREELLNELNYCLDELVNFEDDGVFPHQLVIAAKNYVLVDSEGKRKTKGASLKATTKEKALREFIQKIIDLMLEGREGEIVHIYMEYAREILHLNDMSRWASKHSVTKAVLTGKETAQVRLRQALKGHPVQEGDKFYTFFRTPEERCLLENFDGTYDKSVLLRKLYKTLKVFKSVIDITNIPDLTLVRNKKILQELANANTRLQVPQQEVLEGI